MAQMKKSFIQKNGLIAVWSAAGLIASGYIAFLFLGAGPEIGARKFAVGSSIGTGEPAAAPVQQKLAMLEAEMVVVKERGQQNADQLSRMAQTMFTASFNDPQSGSDEASKPTGYGIDEEPEEAPRTAFPDSSTSVSVRILPLSQDDGLAEVYSKGGFDTYGLSLASARSIDALERHWDYLVKTAGEALEGLKPRYLRKGAEDNPQYELIAGPLDRMSDAQSRCDRLTRLNIDCQNTRYEQGLSDGYVSARHEAGK